MKSEALSADKSSDLIPDNKPPPLPLCVNSNMTIFFIMLWSLYCKATRACFDFLLSVDSDCTYFITYICIITDLTNKKLPSQYIFQCYISSLLHVLHSYTCYACYVYNTRFFNFRFKDRNYTRSFISLLKPLSFKGRAKHKKANWGFRKDTLHRMRWMLRWENSVSHLSTCSTICTNKWFPLIWSN